MRLGLAALPLISLASAGCATGAAGLSFERFVLETTPTAEDHPVVGGVVLLDRGALTFTVDPELQLPVARLRRYVRLKALRPDVLAMGKVVLPYEPGTVIGAIIGQITQPDGSVAPVPEIVDTTVSDGRRAKAFSARDLRAGAVLEYTYDVYYKDLRFIGSWTFQNELPTVRSEMSVTVPTGFEIDLRLTEGGEVSPRSPERFELERGTRLSWTFSDLPAVYREAGRPATARLGPRAHVVFIGAKVAGKYFRGFQSWDDVRKWFVEERVPAWDTLSPEQIAEAKRVAGDAPVEERALKLLEIVARDLSWPKGPRVPLVRAEPLSAGRVLDAKQADATGRGLLLAALLRAAGVDASPAFFAYRDHALLLPDFPVVENVDGIGVVVPRPSGPLFLDPSDLTVSTDVASPRVQGTRVIAIRPESADVVSIPVSLAKDSRAELTLDVKVDPSGVGTGKLEARLTGALAGLLRGELLARPVSDYPALVSAHLGRLGLAVQLDSADIADLAALRRPLLVRGTTRVANLLTGQGEASASVRLDKLLAQPGTTGLTAVRRYPLLVGAPHQAELIATVMFPEDHRPESIPPALEQAWAGGTQRLEVRQETPTRVGLKARVETAKVELSVDEFPAFWRAYEALGRALLGEIVVSRPPAPDVNY